MSESGGEPILEIPEAERQHVKLKIIPERQMMVMRVRNVDSGKFRQRSLNLKQPDLKERAHEFIVMHRTSSAAPSSVDTAEVTHNASMLSDLADQAMTASKFPILQEQYPLTMLEDLPVSVSDNKFMASSFLLVGQSRISGKTKLLTEMYKTWFKKKKNLITVVFAANPQNPLYRKFKKALIFNQFNQEILDNLRTIQRATDNHYTFVIILDDIVSTRYREFLNEAVLTYRNSNIYIIISTQYYALISPSARTNFSWVFMGKFARPEAIEKMSKTLLLDFPGRKVEDKFRNYSYLTRATDEGDGTWTNRWIVLSADGEEYNMEVTA